MLATAVRNRQKTENGAITNTPYQRRKSFIPPWRPFTCVSSAKSKGSTKVLCVPIAPVTKVRVAAFGFVTEAARLPFGKCTKRPMPLQVSPKRTRCIMWRLSLAIWVCRQWAKTILWRPSMMPSLGFGKREIIVAPSGLLIATECAWMMTSNGGPWIFTVSTRLPWPRMKRGREGLYHYKGFSLFP